LDNTLRVWDAVTGEARQAITTTGRIGHALAFSPDGRHIVTADHNGAITVWDWQSGQAEHQTVAEVATPIDAVRFSPDGRYFAAPLVALGDRPGPFVLVWERQTATEAFRLDLRGENASTLAFSPDGGFLAVAGEGSPVAWLWNLQLRTSVQRFNGHPSGTGIVDIEFSPDGRYVATAGTDTTARLWEAETGREIRRFGGHVGAVNSLAFSPDGAWLATAGVDQTARLWDVATGQELRRYVGHTASVENVAFSANGRRLISVSDDGTGRIWDIDYRDTMRYLCSRLLRDLSDAERQRYGILDEAPTCPGS
jgi:WD40 repeat protein